QRCRAGQHPPTPGGALRRQLYLRVGQPSGRRPARPPRHPGPPRIGAATRMKVRAFIADDEPPARSKIRRFLGSGDGFDVLREVYARHKPAVIFTTAYDQYAMRAFEVEALDYLLKPFTADRF